MNDTFVNANTEVVKIWLNILWLRSIMLNLHVNVKIKLFDQIYIYHYPAICCLIGFACSDYGE